MEVIARWESPRGKHWVELLAFENGGFCYRGNGCGGSMVQHSLPEAIAAMQEKVDTGYFLPDSAKIPMREVFTRAISAEA